jgi:hypothetical protein
MSGYIKYEKNEDGTVSRVPAEITEIIAQKEEQLLQIYNELQALKNNQ